VLSLSGSVFRFQWKHLGFKRKHLRFKCMGFGFSTTRKPVDGLKMYRHTVLAWMRCSPHDGLYRPVAIRTLLPHQRARGAVQRLPLLGPVMNCLKRQAGGIGRFRYIV
jgi:hypothetical protein